MIALPYKRIIPWLSLVLAVVLVFFLVLPEYSGWRSDLSELDLAKSDLANKQEALGILSSVDESKVRRLGRIMPDEPEEPELLVQIEDLATKSGVVLSSVNFNTNESAGEVMVRETVTGTYSNLKRYLDNLEDSLRLLDVETISLSSAGDDGLQSLNLSVKAYFLVANSVGDTTIQDEN